MAEDLPILLSKLQSDRATFYKNISIFRLHNVIKGLSIFEYPERGNDPSRLVFIMVALIFIIARSWNLICYFKNPALFVNGPYLYGSEDNLMGVL